MSTPTKTATIAAAVTTAAPATRFAAAVTTAAPATQAPPAAPTPDPGQAALAAGITTPHAPAPAGNEFPILGDDLALRPGWTESLPEEFQPFAKAGQKFDNLGNLLKSYASLEKLRGVPGPEADEEAVAAFRRTNQIPSDPAAYKEALPPLNLPEGLEIPPAILEESIRLGLDNNLTPAQAAKNLEGFVALSKNLADQQQAARAAEVDAAFSALEQEWGRDKDVHYSNAQAAAKMLGLDMNHPDIGDSAVLVKSLAKLHKSLDEDTLRGLAQASPAGGSSGKGDRALAKDIATNPNNPLNAPHRDPSHPGHRAAHDQYDMYNARATGFAG